MSLDQIYLALLYIGFLAVVFAVAGWAAERIERRRNSR